MKCKIKVKTLQCVPFLLCPKCGGEGKIRQRDELGIGNTNSTYGFFVTCNLCNGAMVIPMAVISKKKDDTI